MSLNNLKDLYIDQLQDLYSAECQSRDVVKEMQRKAGEPKLQDALDRGVSGIEDGISSLNAVISRHGENPNGEYCQGMAGLVREARKHAIDADFGDQDVQDASIITQYQRMTHYAMAGYGTALAFARRLELEDDAESLQRCLDATYHGDGVMTAIAEGRVNPAAV